MRILITGATGSLGRALVNRFLSAGHAVCSYARCEVKRAELLHDFPDVHAFLGDVRDIGRLYEAARDCDVVIAAAALKRVDGGYQHTMESIKTNVLGVQNTIDAAKYCGAKKVVVVSSDKAVMAENSYGSTKHLAEFLAVSANEISAPCGTLVSAVRYGNVFASRGSVVGIWQEAVTRGDMLVVTDTDMTRFWLPMRQACDVIEHALDHMRGGEIFVPKLKAMRMGDLATVVAGRSGYPMKITGLRQGGEKRHERLLSDGERERALYADGYIVVPPESHSWCAKGWEGIPVGDLEYRSDVAPFGTVSVEEVQGWLADV